MRFRHEMMRAAAYGKNRMRRLPAFGIGFCISMMLFSMMLFSMMLFSMMLSA